MITAVLTSTAGRAHSLYGLNHPPEAFRIDARAAAVKSLLYGPVDYIILLSPTRLAHYTPHNLSAATSALSNMHTVHRHTCRQHACTDTHLPSAPWTALAWLDYTRSCWLLHCTCTPGHAFIVAKVVWPLQPLPHFCALGAPAQHTRHFTQQSPMCTAAASNPQNPFILQQGVWMLHVSRASQQY
jgi:hypothetical protein